MSGGIKRHAAKEFWKSPLWKESVSIFKKLCENVHSSSRIMLKQKKKIGHNMKKSAKGRVWYTSKRAKTVKPWKTPQRIKPDIIFFFFTLHTCLGYLIGIRRQAIGQTAQGPAGLLCHTCVALMHLERLDQCDMSPGRDKDVLQPQKDTREGKRDMAWQIIILFSNEQKKKQKSPLAPRGSKKKKITQNN